MGTEPSLSLSGSLSHLPQLMVFTFTFSVCTCCSHSLIRTPVGIAEEKMTQIAATKPPPTYPLPQKINNNKKQCGVEGRRDGWQLRNLQATPASCRQRAETDALLSLFPSSPPPLPFFSLSVSSVICRPRPPPVKRQDGTQTCHAGKECPICVCVCLCLCVSIVGV